MRLRAQQRAPGDLERLRGVVVVAAQRGQRRQRLRALEQPLDRLVGLLELEPRRVDAARHALEAAGDELAADHAQAQPRQPAAQDVDGEVLTYAKVHTCDFGPERELTPGTGFPVAELGLASGPVRVGIMICFDREFPAPRRR